MAVFQLPDPLTGWLHNRSWRQLTGLGMHVVIMSLAAFLTAFGGGIPMTYAAISQNPWVCLLLAFGAGCAAAGTVMRQTWLRNLPKGLQAPNDETGPAPPA